MTSMSSSAGTGIARNNRAKSRKDAGRPPPAFTRPPSFGGNDDDNGDVVTMMPRSHQFDIPELHDTEESKEYPESYSESSSLVPADDHSCEYLLSDSSSDSGLTAEGGVDNSFVTVAFSLNEPGDGKESKEYLLTD